VSAGFSLLYCVLCVFYIIHWSISRHNYCDDSYGRDAIDNATRFSAVLVYLTTLVYIASYKQRVALTARNITGPPWCYN